MIDFKAHLRAIKGTDADAISLTRYGYDAERKLKRTSINPFDDPDDDDDHDDLDAQFAAAMARDNS